MIKKDFNENELSFAVSVLLACIIYTGTAGAAAITVDDSGGANYMKVQDAINAASPGDTILVYSGTYNESVWVNKQLTLKGVDNGGGKPVIETPMDINVGLGADGIILDGFKLINGKSPFFPLEGTGIWVSSNSNVIINNTILNNEYAGIVMIYVRNNTISNNIISNNGQFGMHLYRENDNRIYNNIFNNSLNVMTWSTPGGSWNTARTAGANIVEGPYIGGNFWANPGGTGFSQMCADGDNDGICDTVYSIDISNVDYLPLTYKPSTGGLFDDFDDNSVNPSLWTPYTQGTGPSISEVNQRVEITLPANSKDDYSSIPVFSGGYSSICTLKGDFDVQVDYELLDWPDSNGVRVGLGVPGGMTERVSFGTLPWDYPYQPREVYLTHFADGVFGITETNDRSGKLRAVRTGSDLSGYYFKNGSWNLIRKYSSSTTSDGGFSIAVWSHNSIFKGQDVRVAFDNVIVNRGKLVCPDTTPPVTTADISGASGQNGWYTSNVQITLTAEDADGSGISRTEYRYDGAGWITYTAPIVVNSEGTTVLYYRSRDRAQNTESAKELRFKIDKTPPTIAGIPTTSKFSDNFNDNDISDWTKTVNVNSSAIADNGRMRLQVYKCSDVDVLKDLGFISGETIVDFDWQTQAEGWWENTGWKLIVDGIEVVNEGIPIKEYGGYSGHMTKTVNANGNAQLLFGVNAGKYCGNGDHSNTYLWVDNVVVNTVVNSNNWSNNDVAVKFIASDDLSGIDTFTPDTIISTEGASQSVTGTAFDKAGNDASATVSGINIDKTPPNIRINTPADGSEYILNQIVNADWSAEDHLSGVAWASGTVPNGSPIDTTVGTKTFTVNASDNVGHTANKTVNYYVRYVYGGILEPINENGTSIFNSNKNSIVPVKFQLQDSSGNFAPGAVAQINWSKINNTITGNINEDVVTGNATQGNLFAYNSTSNEYFFNIGTLDLVSGTWLISIKLDDGTSKYVNISVK